MSHAKAREPDYQHLEEGGHIEGANTEAERSDKSLKIKEELMVAEVQRALSGPKNC